MAAAGMFIAQCQLMSKEVTLPEKETIERAKKAQRQGKSSSTQSGEFVREENASHQRR
jgi:hypothetical protein